KLEKSEILQIVDLMMKRLRDQMSVHGATVELTQEAKELLVEEGYDRAMGARPLRRAIQRLIEDPLADFVLGRELTDGSTIVVDRRADPGPDDPKVEMRVIEGEVQPEPVTVPPEAPADTDEQQQAPRLRRPRPSRSIAPAPRVRRAGEVRPAVWPSQAVRVYRAVGATRFRNRALPTRPAPARRCTVPDGRRARDHAHLPRWPRPAALRRLRPPVAGRRRGGSTPVLRAVRAHRARARRRDRAGDADVAGQPGLGRAARAFGRRARGPEPARGGAPP